MLWNREQACMPHVLKTGIIWLQHICPQSMQIINFNVKLLIFSNYYISPLILSSESHHIPTTLSLLSLCSFFPLEWLRVPSDGQGKGEAARVCQPNGIHYTHRQWENLERVPSVVHGWGERWVEMPLPSPSHLLALSKWRRCPCMLSFPCLPCLSLQGLVTLGNELGYPLLTPRKKITVMLIGNHSAGKSSFINWYYGLLTSAVHTRPRS